MASFGAVGQALVKACCGGEPAAVRGMGGRFRRRCSRAKPCAWTSGAPAPGRAAFQARVAARDVVVMDNGTFDYEA